MGMHIIRSMIIDMHVHTSFSPCSNINIHQLLKRAAKIGIEGICITDHDTIAAKKVIVDSIDKYGICVIVGIEYTTSKGDFLIFGPVESLHSGMTIEEIFQWTNKEGGIVIPAHPFRKSRPVDISTLPFFEVVESINGRNSAFENNLCNEWILNSGNNYRGIGGSDAHTVDEVGHIVTVFKNNIYDYEDLISELRKNTFSPKIYLS